MHAYYLTEKNGQTKQNETLSSIARLLWCLLYGRAGIDEEISILHTDIASDGRHSIYIGGELTGVKDE